MTSSANVFLGVMELERPKSTITGMFGQRARLDGSINAGEIRPHVVSRLDSHDHAL